MFGRDSLYMLLWAVQLGVAAGLTPLLTRLLDADSFGEMAAATSVMQVVFAFVGLSLHQAIQRQYATENGPHKAAVLLSAVVVVASTIWAVVDQTGTWWAGPLGFDEYGGALRLAVAWAAVSGVTNSCLSLLRCQERLWSFATVSLLQSVASQVISLVLVLAVEATATQYLLGQFLAQVLAVLAGLALARPALFRTRDLGPVLTGLKYSIGLVPAALSGFVMNAADRLIVHGHLTEDAVARYQVAYNIGSMPLLLLAVINTVWMPRVFALSDLKHRAHALAVARDSVNVLLSPTIAGLSLAAPLVLRLWMPEQYDPDSALSVTVVVAVSSLPYAAGLAAQRVLLTDVSTWWIAFSSIIGAAVNIALNLLFVPKFGIMGSSLATLLSYGLVFAVQQARARTLLHVPAADARVVLNVVAAVAICGLAAAVPTDGVLGWARVAGCVMVAVWFLVALRSLSRSTTTTPTRRAIRHATWGTGGRARHGEETR